MDVLVVAERRGARGPAAAAGLGGARPRASPVMRGTRRQFALDTPEGAGVSSRHIFEQDFLSFKS
jgi:hypothetical protein